jgi:hypothetical protein
VQRAAKRPHGTGPGPRLGAGLVAVAVAFATGCGPALDVGPQDPTVAASTPSVTPASASASIAANPKQTPIDGYVYVARREHVSIGLAEAREIHPEDAKRLIDQLTDRFEACAVKLEGQGLFASGAGRLVVLIDERGHVIGTDAKLAPGSDVAGAALLCLLAPARALGYPPGKGSRRGFAVEAKWEPSRS